ncbi:P-loop containing nucleoside triphosphate hydrolase protein [Zychaea mexicana]|uniref:P-loop containing nucleoside triphosphate hydrolase protein n=1 Tax=Zychaea mexicana TaxID=64656 RepID=UPI0022FEB33A|nr:P-loop containing nucleoside triphosphate hydrolase protein [Zychaea mexicana]KAI9498450.1 P-loop containing nucleoside triphosphate hydrolase protein [Zychaea mexicana]
MTPAAPDHHDLYNPLAFDLPGAIRQLLQVMSSTTTATARNDNNTTIDARLLERYVDNPTLVPGSQVLDTLSVCLLHSAYTRSMISLFRPIVLDLVARWATPAFLREPNVVNRIERVAKAFSIVLPAVPQVKSLAVTYFINSPSLFERLNHLPHNVETTASATAGDELQDLLLTTYRLLSFSTSTFAPLWNWGPMVELLKSPNECIRYLTILCLGKAYGLSDLQTRTLLGTSDEPLMAIIDGTKVNLRMLRLWEEQNLAQQQLNLTQNNFTTTQQYIEDSDLSSLTCNLCGVLLPRTAANHRDSLVYRQQLILTETTTRNLNTLSLALSIGAPTFLEGVTGAGKTSIVEELANRTGRADQLIKIHLGDQTDPKVLLGTYVSTSTPGSFKWQPGVLTTAVQEGRWVLIEDIDLAPAEVISVLLPLLETRQLFIPSRGEKITAKEGFQLFGTRSFIPSRSTSKRKHQLVTGANLWTRVLIEPLSMDELETVIREKFRHIGSFSVHVMRLFQAVINIYQDPNFATLSTMGRYISTRDLMKWCHRINTRLNVDLNGHTGGEAAMDMAIREDLFSEAIDCFCGMIPDYATWVTVLERVGEPLQLSAEYVRNYVDQRKPPLRHSENSQVVIGRADLSSIAAGGKTVKRGPKRPFATTGHALRLLERISVCVLLNEPTLLVGETGTGKTTVVQQLADMLNQNLVVVNLSQQSDSSDLLGGFKPVEGKILAMPLKEMLEDLFERTFKMDEKNTKFLDTVRKAFVRQKWKYFVALMQHAIKTSHVQFNKENNGESKKQSPPELRKAWKMFEKQVADFEVQQTQAENNFVFNFMEGSLVKAVRRGDWILLDEINLATTETLECLSGLLQDADGSLLLTEKGDIEPIQRHPNFRLFACMNPATDVGKRDLPPGLRNRFTEFYVHPPDQRYEDLLQIVRRYLGKVAVSDERSCDDVAEFYLEAKKLSQQHQLVDGANQKPHFSMRTLSRALTYVVQIYPTYGLRRSLYEGFCMTFLTQLNKESEALMRQLIYKTILRGVKNPAHLISQIPAQPSDDFIQFGYFWLEQGQYQPEDDGHYILTQSVETNLYNLARVIMSRKFPVLIQGPTSAGKTSMIEFLAKKTGHRFVRINNHEHTDLQEYLGTYVSNSQGKLVFQEGVLVEALRNGYWIVLDELNLAPSDVLEALNRLLDDNRELLIPETQEVVKPHPHFMLFATQNPAGLYGGRKALSRAFRNRFLELHFDDIPQDELEMILSQRCQIAPSYCKKLVQVYKSLMEHRKSSRLFEQKHSFITLRDLFRWAGRDPNGYQELAEHGYMLLAERCRKDEEKKVVKQVLESVMKVKLDEDVMYDCERLEEFAIYDKILRDKSADTKLVWTKAMRRLFSLVARCLRYKEPVLLVGETGCGKTTVCQMLAETFNRELHIVNCHQNTETGDLLGGQRPVRNHDSDQLFEWHDGPLVQALRGGHLFLLDEISLADDSVLERLNSVLEPSRLLVLAEKGGKHVEELIGQEGFQFLATMNPGGDYGKKELSPALRNRFTEIWVPSVIDRDDLTMIIDEQLAAHPALNGYGTKMLDFIGWFTQSLGQTRTVVSLRDILSWVQFIHAGVVERNLDPDMTFAHGGCLVLLDGLGSHGASGSFLSGDTLKDFRLKCLRQLASCPDAKNEETVLGETQGQVNLTDDEFAIGPFLIERGPLGKANIKFTLLAPTTSNNAMRVARAMQLKKPILLEGSPGVGKTSLVSALAAAAGHRLVRINLSEQTDLMDLFGSDLPVEGGDSGEFAWRDAPFLQAMKQGDWVLLDELNLASQSVLEGLNSCLDHRGAVYIPELDREFFCAQGFRVFGAQNPLQQGGGRKGLPKSFVNRFTQVYVEHLTADDLLFICGHLFPQFDAQTLKQMIEFNTHMYEETMVRCRFGRKGSPWEFNLRDVFRWLELMQKDSASDPSEYLETIYLQRMRTCEDRVKVIELYEHVFGTKYTRTANPAYHVSPGQLVVGHSRLPRLAQKSTPELDEHLLHTFLAPLEALMKCVESGWMAIVTGPSASGKTSLVRLLSRLTGNRLQEFAMNNSVDTMELLGGFEQVDLNRHRQVVMDALERVTSRLTRALLMAQSTNQQPELLQHVRQLNDAWFTLKTQQRMSQQSDNSQQQQQLDYALLESIVEQLNQAALRVDTDALVEITAMVEAAQNLQQLEKSSVAGKFEWIDGLLIHALEQGHWLLIDNANLCNPSVLDRLNPLFENDGVLMVNERGLIDGQVKVIKPHPNFRMFMTVDPNNGELSRAMRNRGIEISLVDANWNTTDVQDATKLVNSLGLRGARMPVLLNELQATANAALRNKGSVRDYLMLATYVVERLQRGQSLKDAIQASYHHVFMEDAPDMDMPDLLEQALSPTNCPYFIGGAMVDQDSSLATVSVQGACLLYLLQQPEQDEHRVEVAMDYFLESLLSEDANLRLHWLAYIAEHASVSNTTAIDRVMHLLKTVCKDQVFHDYSHKTNSLPFYSIKNLQKAYSLVIRLCKYEHAVKTVQKATMRLKLGSMTALQQSYSFHDGRLTEAQLLHPIVKKVSSFFTTVDYAMSQWLSSKAYQTCHIDLFDRLQQILDTRDFAWRIADSRPLSLDNYLNNLRLVQALVNDLDFAKIISDVVDDTMAGFDFETCRSMKALWQYFAPATLASQSLFDVEQELHSISTQMDSYQHSGKGKNINASLSVSYNITL